MQLEGHPAIVRLCRFYQHIRGALPTSISASRPAARLPSGFSPCGFSPCGFSPCGFSPWGFSPCGCNTSRNHGGGSSVASHCAARRLLRVVTTERRSGLSFSPRPQEGYRNTLSHKTRWSLATTNAAL
jgi:hypothetical protein